jgi:DnaJ-class molecular chaperone
MASNKGRRDFYRDLGVERDAPEEEIKRAYRALAKKWHPDTRERSADDVVEPSHDMFRYLSEAYDVLQDRTKRAKYDRKLFGKAPTGAARAQSMREAALASEAELLRSRERLEKAQEGGGWYTGQEQIHDRGHEAHFANVARTRASQVDLA